MDKSRIPKHVGIIMDGNGRWAESRGLTRIEGHKVGAERAKEMVRHAAGLGIKALTLYTFSLENWQRPRAEVTLLMKMLEAYLKRERGILMDENVRFRAIGETSLLPKGIRRLIDDMESETADNDRMTLCAALSYGGRNEIVRAVRRALESGLGADGITEESLGALMDTAGIPEPDLIIRTSGEVRMSNFLLWQSAYSELYFTDTYWPDFGLDGLKAAIEDYAKRERRFGGVKKKAKKS